MKRVLFRRDIQKLRGGHLKVFDYFEHVRTAAGYEAHIHFAPESAWDERNPWLPHRADAVPAWDPYDADILFVEGVDWRHLPEADRADFPVPIVNLIQGLRHADPEDERRTFLRNRAIRVCVSDRVAEAITATGEVNGPVFTVPNGVDLAALPPAAGKTLDLLVDGVKQKRVARGLRWRLWRPGRSLRVLRHRVPREDYLDLLARARVAVFLPKHAEGFYLPPLEAMALGAVVVCPDAGGNRTYLDPDRNGFLPEYDPRSIVAAARRALALEPNERAELTERARETAARFDLPQERRAFLEVLARVPQLWHG